MTILNYTPHTIKVVLDNKTNEFASQGVARCSFKSEKVAEVDGIPCFATKYGEIENLPPQKDGFAIVVSALVRSQAPERLDLLSPSGLVRDGQGNVIGCSGFDTNGIQRLNEKTTPERLQFEQLMVGNKDKDREETMNILNGTGKQENFETEKE